MANEHDIKQALIRGFGIGFLIVFGLLLLVLAVTGTVYVATVAGVLVVAIVVGGGLGALIGGRVAAGDEG